jgi:hypothetical protein
MERESVEEMLQRLSTALSEGDVKGIASCWSVPALVLSDQGTIAVSSLQQVQEFFKQATEWYHQQGLMSTRGELERFDKLSERLAEVDVRWPAFDAEGVEKSSESSHYIVGLDNDGQPRIRVALTRAA